MKVHVWNVSGYSVKGVIFQSIFQCGKDIVEHSVSRSSIFSLSSPSLFSLFSPSSLLSPSHLCRLPARLGTRRNDLLRNKARARVVRVGVALERLQDLLLLRLHLHAAHVPLTKLPRVRLLHHGHDVDGRHGAPTTTPPPRWRGCTGTAVIPGAAASLGTARCAAAARASQVQRVGLDLQIRQRGR